MNTQYKIILIPFFALFTFIAKGQTILQNNIETTIESIIENLDEETDALQILEDLEAFAETPININASSEPELSKLHLLNEIQIQKLLKYIAEFGPAYSIYELNTIDNFTPDILEKLQTFIWFGPEKQATIPFSERLKYGKHQVLIRSLGTVQKADGFLSRENGSIPFEGNRLRYYSRYRFQASEDISFGITAEKDPGEAFFQASNKTGFDFYSGHLSFKINDLFENITIGDFMVRSGQGLVLWQGYSMGKSANTLSVTKTNQGIRPFSSTDENQFFRGIAGTLKLGKTKFNLFYSQQKNDGNLIATDSIFSHFSSLQISGYHRTENEIADENAIRNTNIGGFATWNFNHLKIGTTFHFQQFNYPFIRSEQLYNQFKFSGSANYTAGTDYLFSKGKYQLFGEAAISKSKGTAVLQGLTAHLDDRFTYSILFRKFDKKYHALWGSAFSEQTKPNNEAGVYFGTKIIPLKKVILLAYADFYEFEWITFNTMAPARGFDFFIQADYKFSEKTEIYIRYKNEEKDKKTVLQEKSVNGPEQIKKTRLHFQHTISESIILKTRFEHAFFSGIKNENGFLFFQDIQFTPKKIPVNVSARIAWFNTESYNSRIYAYENDLLYTFSIPAYYGKGFRTYFNLKYKINEKLDFWVKLANTLWNDRESISSGYNEIFGNNKTELKFQLRLKF